MSKKSPSVLITLDSMKDQNTGFFHFGKALSAAIIKQSGNKFDLSFYVKNTIFDDNRKVIEHHKFHKFYFPGFNQFELVHITDQFCRLRPDRVKGRKILTIHDLNQLHQPNINPKVASRSLALLGKHIKNCDRVVAISKFVAADICLTFPESASKVSVIYNGADKLLLDDDYTPPYVPKKKFLFTLGPLNEKKNFHVIPALLQNTNYELVISGITPTPSYTELLLSKAKEFGCENRVTITGTITDQDKAWYYKNCTAFILPSLAEGFGLPVIEAMHFGKPVFLSNKTSLPEVGGNCAFYFNNFEAGHMQQVFSNGMLEYVKSYMEPDIIAHAATFSWDKTAAQYISLYEELMAKRASYHA